METWKCFESPISGEKVVRYHGGVAVIEKMHFNFQDEKPTLETNPIGFDTPNGVYFFRRDCSNPTYLETYQVTVLRDGSEETKKLRRSIEDRLRKNPYFLGQVIALG